MALRCTNLLRIIRNSNVMRVNLITTSVALPEDSKHIKPRPKEFKTENNIIYLEDPDNFGTLTRGYETQSNKLEDEDDVKEEEYLKNKPLSSQKLTSKQYADLIKQYLKHKRLKEAIDILEVKMLKEDRVKPENYIYNILIGACADVGYTKKAFKLYNEMKRRALRPTGDTYTCLFHACANSPWQADGLKNAKHLRELMIEKGIEPNLTNYNAMVKAFGQCGDLPTAFQIVDEMKAKKIKIRVHTFNHLLHACISDKQNGLAHAIAVWWKMLMMREKPNIYTFNLMLKCVKDCNLGKKEDIAELITSIQKEMHRLQSSKLKQIQSDSNKESEETPALLIDSYSENHKSTDNLTPHLNTSTELTLQDNKDNIRIEIVNKLSKDVVNDRIVPNLLSKVLNLQQVTALQEVYTPQEKFSVIGGQEDFLKEMQVYSVIPDVKTFTQMIPLLENNTEAENKLLEAMKSLNVNGDISFYNMLIKKRCLRSDYDAAFDVKNIIKKESEFRKKRYPHSKKLKLKENIMTFGVWAMACKTKVNAEKLLNEMKEKQLKVNMEILGTLLRQGTAHNNFGYVLFIMNIVKNENIQVNDMFLKHLENFSDKCNEHIKKIETSEVFKKSYGLFHKYYSNWLKEINVEKVLKQEHPWQQFKEKFPQTVQNDNVQIQTPKKFYKKNKKFVRYTPKIVN